MLDHSTKQSIINKYQVHENDDGSPQVQIALLTENIASLTEHLKENRKDYHSRRGLIKMVAKRKKLLNYLKHKDEQMFRTVVSDLGIRAQ